MRGAPTPEEIVALLGMRPHPEGGHFVETWRDPAPAGQRAAGSAIYFLLARGQASAWHRIDAAEVWHHYLGQALELEMADALAPEVAAGAARSGEAGPAVRRSVLGKDLAGGERPQAVVPPGVWQRARPLGAFALVGCTVAPAFLFERFELAPAYCS